MPDKIKIESKLISGEASGGGGIVALVVIVIIVCATAYALASN
jgi:hypothetical protein